MAFPTSNNISPLQRKRERFCAWNFQTAAIVVTFVSLLNGAASFVYGIQIFIDGGSFVPDEDTVEVAVGTIIGVISLLMLGVLYTRLRVSHFFLIGAC